MSIWVGAMSGGRYGKVIFPVSPLVSVSVPTAQRLLNEALGAFFQRKKEMSFSHAPVRRDIYHPDH